VQAAVDALPEDGGIVFVPRGTWPVTAGVMIEKPNVTILGETAGSVLRAATANAFDLMTVKRHNFQIRDVAARRGRLLRARLLRDLQSRNRRTSRAHHP